MTESTNGRASEGTELQSPAVAVLVFLAGAARARVVSSDCLLDMDWHPALLLAPVGDKIRTACLHPAHVRLTLLLCRSLTGLRSIPERDMGSEQE